MEHRPVESIPWEPAPAEHFTGKVWFGPLSAAAHPMAINALGVMFEPGARTDWHSHPDGQVLYVVNGSGRVASASGEVADVSAGDVVYAPPGERHWHGASPGSYMVHLSLTTGGATEWSADKVTGDQYGF